MVLELSLNCRNIPRLTALRQLVSRAPLRQLTDSTQLHGSVCARTLTTCEFRMSCDLPARLHICAVRALCMHAAAQQQTTGQSHVDVRSILALAQHVSVISCIPLGMKKTKAASLCFCQGHPCWAGGSLGDICRQCRQHGAQRADHEVAHEHPMSYLAWTGASSIVLPPVPMLSKWYAPAAHLHLQC